MSSKEVGEGEWVGLRVEGMGGEQEGVFVKVEYDVIFPSICYLCAS